MDTLSRRKPSFSIIKQGLLGTFVIFVLVQGMITPIYAAPPSSTMNVLKTIANEMTPVALTFDRSGNLWVANSDPYASHLHNIVEFNTTSLGRDNPAASKTITDGLSEPQGLAFDLSGNLWVANRGSCLNPCSTVLEFNSTSVASSNPKVSKTIPVPGYGPDYLDLAFDQSGNLWVAEGYNGVVEFNSTTLASPTPRPSRVAVGPNVLHLTFDSKNNLWVSIHGYKADWISEYTNVSNPNPSLTLPTGIGGGLAFDSTNDLWVAGYLFLGYGYSSSGFAGAVDEFTQAALAMGQRAMASKIITDGLGDPRGLAFDSSGNLWVADLESDTILEFNSTSLASTNSTVSRIIGTGPGLHSPQGLVFDFSGNLWAGNTRKILGFYSACLGSSSNSPKTVYLPSSPDSLALDSSGNLWVAEGSTILEFNSTSFASGNPTPARSLALLTAPGRGLTFDSSGDLWIAETGDQGGWILEINATSLASNRPSPWVRIQFGFARNPGGLAFDSSGNLWVSTSDQYFPNYPGHLPGDVEGFNRTSLAGPRPAVWKTITDGIGSTAGSLVFDSSGSLWVTNSTFNILKFNGTSLSNRNPTVSQTLGQGLTSPAGLTFDASGKLWVSNIREDNIVALGNGSLPSASTNGSLKVRVSGPNGPLPSATVTVASGPNGATLSSPGTTNFDGSVTFSAMAQGSYTYNVAASGYKNGHVTVTVTACLTQYSSVVLSPDSQTPLSPSSFALYAMAGIGTFVAMIGLLTFWRRRRPRP